ncbi:LADA_0F12134g1_1 [Lachancea dasiensis]|uniref:LADA_0F12134g1_1 n=1 Tax=Lachancea dasiensis TaxID=1072105 RepID=A0A1G4JMK3_9SACH|nr:LADA_0F12134g1_1 [Lachancea dasiensis]
MSFATQSIHGDDECNRVPDVAPPINVSTTYRFDNDNLVTAAELDPSIGVDEQLVYARESHPNAVRLEHVISKLLGAPSVVYSSGLSAYFAALIRFKPKKLFQAACYHSCVEAAEILSRIGGLKVYTLDDIDAECGPGDLIHIESPLNPYGECVDVSHYAERAHKVGAKLLLDATLAPPPLSNPWDLGADIVMHSGTKYFGGHSDLLCGIIAVKDVETARLMRNERLVLGTIPASLESFLMLRSLRTMELRVRRQAENCTALVKYLNDHKAEFGSVLKHIHHGSLQQEEFVKKQMTGGFGPLFSIILNSPDQCVKLVKNVKLFQHATSLGGVESLIEWRAMSDSHIDKKLVRLSVGVEHIDDLIDDLVSVLKRLESGDL